ncbi:zinc finger protein 182-like isoform X2 [Corythoichthys intestinalis]|uniref:zinc finger protein 182-like isoform X2 n=1 Tax=Corythoichthys intestinalis TaxID=161448 RepID=UPI0025A627E4|nr:zinc finger protein 182-like isoform X2 [Corythoichthys intestinalis]
MDKVEMMRALLNARLSAAVEEIAVVFASTITQYEEELCRSKAENERQRQQLDSVYRPRNEAPTADNNEVLPLEQQQYNSMVEQHEPEPAKYEVEEWAAPCTFTKEEPLQQFELPYSHVILKNEYQKNKSRSEDNASSSSSQHVTTDGDGGYCGALQADSRPPPLSHACSAAPDDEHTRDKYLPPEQQENQSTTGFTLSPKPATAECSSPTALMKMISIENGWTEEEHKWNVCFKQEEKTNRIIDCPPAGNNEDVVCKSQVHLKQHEENRSAEPPSPLETCGELSKGDVTCHPDNTHWKCSQCGETFGAKKNLRSHMMVHSGEKHRLLVRTETHLVTDTGENTTEEQDSSLSDQSTVIDGKKVQTSKKGFKCSVCSHRFSFKCNLLTHMRVHTGEKPFSCSVCGHIFSIKSNLLTHMRVHTGEKPFACSMCGMRFSQKASVTHHIRTHTGERPFSCSVCKISFAHPVSLVRHMRIHTGEQFVCPDCGLKFLQKWNLRNHKCTGSAQGRKKKS